MLSIYQLSIQKINKKSIPVFTGKQTILKSHHCASIIPMSQQCILFTHVYTIFCFHESCDCFSHLFSHCIVVTVKVLNLFIASSFWIVNLWKHFKMRQWQLWFLLSILELLQWFFYIFIVSIVLNICTQ